MLSMDMNADCPPRADRALSSSLIDGTVPSISFTTVNHQIRNSLGGDKKKVGWGEGRARKVSAAKHILSWCEGGAASARGHENSVCAVRLRANADML